MADSPQVAHARRRLEHGPRVSEAYLRILAAVGVSYGFIAGLSALL